MSDVAIANPIQRSPKREIRADYVTAKLKDVLDAMVWDGLPYNDAAKLNNVSVFTVRNALKRPAVLKYMREQRQMLLASDEPRRIHRYIKISEAAENMPAVAALRELDQKTLEIEGRGSIHQSTQGITINVVSTKPMVDVSPNACAIRAVDEKGE